MSEIAVHAVAKAICRKQLSEDVAWHNLDEAVSCNWHDWIEAAEVAIGAMPYAKQLEEAADEMSKLQKQVKVLTEALCEATAIIAKCEYKR